MFVLVGFMFDVAHGLNVRGTLHVSICATSACHSLMPLGGQLGTSKLPRQ